VNAIMSLELLSIIKARTWDIYNIR